MLRGDRELMFDIESEFLTDDFEGFAGCLAENDSTEERVDMLLSGFITHHLFIILGDGEGRDGRSVKALLGGIVPVPAAGLHFRFRHREILLSNRLVIAERGELMRKEFSPFSRGNHMIDDATAEGFVFLGGIGSVQDTVFCVFQGNVSERLCA